MSRDIDGLAAALFDQLDRLDALDMADSEAVARECLRSRAVNDTAGNILKAVGVAVMAARRMPAGADPIPLLGGGREEGE